MDKETANSSQEASKVEFIYFGKCWLSELPMILLTTFLFISSIYLTIIYPGTIQDIKLFGVELPLPLFGIFPLVSLAFLLGRRYNYRYLIADEYLRAVHGRFSLNKRDMRIAFRDILGIEIDRSLLERMLNVGDLLIGTAMLGSAEVVFKGIHDPSKYRNIIIERSRKFVDQATLPHVRHRLVVDAD